MKFWYENPSVIISWQHDALLSPCTKPLHKTVTNNSLAYIKPCEKEILTNINWHKFRNEKINIHKIRNSFYLFCEYFKVWLLPCLEMTLSGSWQTVSLASHMWCLARLYKCTNDSEESPASITSNFDNDGEIHNYGSTPHHWFV